MKTFSVAGLVFLLCASALSRPSHAGAVSEITPEQFSRSIAATSVNAGFTHKTGAFASFGGERISAFEIQMPGCNAPAILIPAYYESLDRLKYMASTLQLRHPENNFTFIYADHKASMLSRYAINWQRSVLTVQSWFGANRYVPVKAAVIISSPAGCEGLRELDWSGLWTKDRNAHS